MSQPSTPAPGADNTSPPAGTTTDVAAGAAAIDAALAAPAADGDAGMAAIEAALAATPSDAIERDDDSIEATPPTPPKPKADLPNPDAAAAATATPADGAAPPKDGTPPHAGQLPPGQAATPPPGADKVEPDPEIAAEAKELGLKDKANERFVAMATEIKALAPIKAELEKHGIKDVAHIPQMVERARAADDMIGMVMSTGATSEQYGKTLDYLAVINQATTGDAAAGEKAWEMYLSEGRELAKLLGKEMPGVHDPLADFPDLAAEVAGGDLKRERAIEVAGQRRQASLVQNRQQLDSQQQMAQRQAEAAAQTSTDAIQAFDQRMLADPVYLANRATLSAHVAFIKQSQPPHLWAQATEAAWQAMPKVQPTPAAAAPAPPAGAPAPRVAGSALRPAHSPRSLQPEVFDDPMDAIEAGIARAGGG